MYDDRREGARFCGKDCGPVFLYNNAMRACRVHVDERDGLISKMGTSYGPKETIFH